MKSVFMVAVVLAVGGVCGAGERVTVRVVSYNIRHGMGMDNKVDVGRIAGVIAKQKADLVAMQEVDNGCKRSGKIDETAEVAKLTGLKGFFGKSCDYSGGGYGNALLSRFEQRGAGVTLLPRVGEARSYSEVRVEVPGLEWPVIFIGTHLAVESAEARKKQAEALAGHLKELPGEAVVIVAGDLNAEPGDGCIESLVKGAGWTDATAGLGGTWPADRPKSRIDYILVRAGKLGCKVVKAEVVEENVASDHRPVRVEVELGKGE